MRILFIKIGCKFNSMKNYTKMKIKLLFIIILTFLFISGCNKPETKFYEKGGKTYFVDKNGDVFIIQGTSKVRIEDYVEPVKPVFNDYKTYTYEVKWNDLNIFYRTEKSINATGLDACEIFEWCFDLSKKYKYYFIINPCQPFLNPSTIDKFIETFLNSESEGILSALKVKDFFWNNNKELDKTQFFDVEPDKFIFNTRFVKETYKASHGLQIGLLKDLVKGKWMGTFKKDDPELFFVEEEESFDIDYPWEFEIGRRYWC